ncbi:MAG: amidophosphoribosyltransferase [Cytophagales bacterium]
MSEQIKHECGIAHIRLKKSLQYYIDKYETPLYGLNKLYLLMEKQHNRGQDGAGIASIKLNAEPGIKYIDRTRSIARQPIQDIFGKVQQNFRAAFTENKSNFFNEKWLKKNIPFSGESLLGHLRYGTHGDNSIAVCHPMLRENNWRSRNLVVAGNFNLTNVDELFDFMMSIGQHPREKADTVTVMEKIGHFLDMANQEIFDAKKDKFNHQEISRIIENELDLTKVLTKAARDFDGGYVMAGITGYGASFVARDPSGIRPAYFYEDDEIIVVTSEKPPIKTAFNVDFDKIQELPPAHALVIDKYGNSKLDRFTENREKKSCSFERIYFSRGTDPDIYQERKSLGKLLVPEILKSIDLDFENTVFSYIPNTAETAFLGMTQEIDDHIVSRKRKIIEEGKIKGKELDKVLKSKMRVEKLVLKDVKMRTFITKDEERDDMVAHVYDTTYELVKKGLDTIVVIDDSIVRGTTLEKSIIKMLDRLGPKKIIIVSSAPQIRFPDCYGINMSRMQEFIAFRAACQLLKEAGKENKLDDVMEKCINSMDKPVEEIENYVKELYEEFSYVEISNKIAEIITTDDVDAEVQVIYQTVENLNKAIPKHLGDWYFTGNYPTPGGNRVVNRSFINFMKGSLERAY